MLAAAYGSANDVALILKHFGSYTIDSCMHPLGLAALHIAVNRGSIRLVKILLEAGACRLVAVHVLAVPEALVFSDAGDVC